MTELLFLYLDSTGPFIPSTVTGKEFEATEEDFYVVNDVPILVKDPDGFFWSWSFIIAFKVKE